MFYETYDGHNQWSMYRGTESIHRQHQQISHEEDLAAIFSFDDFNEMISFDNTSSTSTNNAPVTAAMSHGSSGTRSALLRLTVVSRNLEILPNDQMSSIETATQRLMEMDMGGRTDEPSVVYVHGRTEGSYRCAWNLCDKRSPPELQLPMGMAYYCPCHYAPRFDRVSNDWRMRCVARTKRGTQCSLRDYCVLHPGVTANEFRCKLHWPTMRGLVFRTSPKYKAEQHLVSYSSSVGIARRLLKDRQLLPSFIDMGPRDSRFIHITLDGCHWSVFSEELFNDLTQGFDKVLKENIRRLVTDYFRLLEASFHQDRRLVYSGSIISWRYQNDDRSALITECLKPGSVYFLLYNPANPACEKPPNNIAIKIGNTQNMSRRVDDHSTQCQVCIKDSFLFPMEGDIPFAYLLEEIVHEMLRAHQHDIACQCGKTHTELYWFPGSELNKYNIFHAVMKTLGPIIHHWIAAIKNLHHLHAELQRANLAIPHLQ
ncbi:hypothetical protein EC968_007950 [Mortierella alpina]|nr:hypothetical protein EC968_007950 [Mortierella alpina]